MDEESQKQISCSVSNSNISFFYKEVRAGGTKNVVKAMMAFTKKFRKFITGSMITHYGYISMVLTILLFHGFNLGSVKDLDHWSSMW